MTLSLAEVQLRRALGAYYTPRTAAEYLADWAIRSGNERVLEPSVGDGAFVVAVRRVAATRGGSAHVIGVEISADTFGDVMSSPGRPDEGINSDFLSVGPRAVDVVIGNPPFVRLRNLDKRQRATAARAAERAMGAAPDASGSVWLPFVAHATRSLVPGGRLALVLPLEATHVKYARPLWKFLADRFGALRVVRVRDRIFGDILQDVVLLLADQAGSRTERVEFDTYDDTQTLVAGQSIGRRLIPVAGIVAGDKPFTRALLPTAAAELLRERLETTTSPASNSVKFNIGYVTGDKNFFHPDASAIAEYGLPAQSLRSSVASAHKLVGGGLRTSSLGDDHRTHLYLPDPSAMTTGDERYIGWGKRKKLDRKYKCKIREPWYVVRSVKTPDLILTVFSDRPLLLLNDAGLAASNSLLCGYLRPGADAAAIAAAWYTPLTLLSIELAVHSLGGGVLILVPNEADAVRLAHGVSAEHLPAVEQALRDGDSARAYDAGAAAMAEALRLTRPEAELLLAAREVLAHWRTSRAASSDSASTQEQELEGEAHACVG